VLVIDLEKELLKPFPDNRIENDGGTNIVATAVKP
jgi:hypothetical protein